MPWVKFDDRFPWHRKIRRLSSDAFRLHVSAICWSSEHLTDGFVPTGDLELVSDVRRPRPAVDELVKANTWEATEGGWRIHDYLGYNASRDEVLEQRRRDAERKRRGRDSDSRRNPGGVQEESARTPGGVPAESGRPVPSRPVPSPVPTTSGAGAPADNVAAVVAAWIEGAQGSRGERPPARLVNQIGQQARELVSEHRWSQVRLEQAAHDAGAKGFADLPRELIRTAPGAALARASPNGVPMSTSDLRAIEGSALAKGFEGQ